MKTPVSIALMLLLLPSCDIMEMRGFVTSYVDVNERFEQSVAWNDENGFREISVGQSSYSIHVMGDAHVGGTRNLDQFFEDGKAMDVAAVVMAGDITTGNKKDYEVLAAHLPDNAALNYFAIAGNHDLYFDGWQYFYEIFGSSTYYFTVSTPEGDDLYICLDSGGGTLGGSQLSWLKNILKTRDKYRYCTIITHNNLFRMRPTASTNPMVEEIRALTDLFVRYDVNVVITAHDHVRNIDMLGNTKQIIMDALLDSNEDASYLKLSVDDTQIMHSFIEL